MHTELISSSKKDLTILELFSILRKQYKLIIIFVAGFIVLGILFLIFSTPKYEARALFGPNPQHLFFGNESRVQDSLLSIAGLSNGSESPLTEFLATISSVDLATALFEEKELGKKIFSDQWNESAGKWESPRSPLSRIAALPNLLIGEPLWREPTAEDLAGYISREVNVSPFGDTPYFELTYQHPDATFSANFLEILYTEADKMLRLREQHQIEQSRAYLVEQLAEVNVQEQRDVLAQLLLETERKKMLLSDELGFSVRILDHPKIPSVPTTPKPLLSLIIFAAFGAMLPIMYFVFRYVRHSIVEPE